MGFRLFVPLDTVMHEWHWRKSQIQLKLTHGCVSFSFVANAKYKKRCKHLSPQTLFLLLLLFLSPFALFVYHLKVKWIMNFSFRMRLPALSSLFQPSDCIELVRSFQSQIEDSCICCCCRLRRHRLFVHTIYTLSPLKHFYFYRKSFTCRVSGIQFNWITHPRTQTPWAMSPVAAYTDDKHFCKTRTIFPSTPSI